MAITLDSRQRHKIKTWTYRLKGVNGSKIASTEVKQLEPAFRGDQEHLKDREILVREIGNNNRFMRKFETKTVMASELEERPESAGPDSLPRDFEYADGLVVRDGPDPSRLFGDPIWIMKVKVRTPDNYLENLITADEWEKEQLVFECINLRNKKSFELPYDGLNEICWIPWGRYKHGGYYTRAGSQYQEKKNGKFKSMNIVQTHDPKDTYCDKFGELNRLKDVISMSDAHIDEFLYGDLRGPGVQLEFDDSTRDGRLEEQRKHVLNIEYGGCPPQSPAWQPSNSTVLSPREVRTQTESYYRDGLARPDQVCNLREHCPAFVTENGILRTIKPFFSLPPSWADRYPKHYHLEDSDCPVSQDGTEHKIHCVFRTREDRECIISFNFLHSCCNLSPAPAMSTQETSQTGRSNLFPPEVDLCTVPADIKERGIEDRDLHDAAAAKLSASIAAARDRASYLAALVDKQRLVLSTNRGELSRLQQELQQEIARTPWQQQSHGAIGAPLPMTGPHAYAGQLTPSELMPPPPPPQQPYHQNKLLGPPADQAVAAFSQAPMMEGSWLYPADFMQSTTDMSGIQGLPDVYTPTNTPLIDAQPDGSNHASEYGISPAALSFEEATAFVTTYQNMNMTH